MTEWIASSGRTSMSHEEDDSIDIWRVVQACFAGGGYARRLLPARRCSPIIKLINISKS